MTRSNYWTVAARLIRIHEGLKLKPYRCSAGKRTIGYGHNIDANGLPAEIAARLKRNGQITVADAEALLDADMQIAERDCMRLFPAWETYTDNRKAALIDFLFNVGVATARKFKIAIGHVNAGHWEAAASAMLASAWARQVGRRSGTVTRMIEEG